MAARRGRPRLPGPAAARRQGSADGLHDHGADPGRQGGAELRQAQASDASDDSLRQKGGWLTSFRQLREQENVHRAEQELAVGHASYRFTAYVTVSAPGADELEAACAEAEQAASRSHLELERLIGQQELAFTYTCWTGTRDRAFTA